MEYGSTVRYSGLLKGCGFWEGKRGVRLRSFPFEELHAWFNGEIEK